MEIYILTSGFPYLHTEQFLETEILYWANFNDIQVTLLPSKKNDIARIIPNNIEIDCAIANSNLKIKKAYSILAAIRSKIFWHEIIWLIKNKLTSVENIFSALQMSAATYFIYNSLKNIVIKKTTPVVIYSYWFDAAAYAAALLRREGFVCLLISRAHGYDIYEERRPGNYMPVKRQFSNDFDQIHSISDNGKNYLQDKYYIPADVLRVNRLGVKVSNAATKPSSAGCFTILSVSSMIKIKRLDRIICAIEILANKTTMRHVNINWIHIGDGELSEQICALARLTFDKNISVKFSFLGHLSNEEVLAKMYKSNIDVFINVSETEGIPVSIMEAMSFGIPVIAPAIGGIPEIVNSNNGILLSEKPTVTEISEALSQYAEFKKEGLRENAKQTIKNRYNADKNYTCFVKAVVQDINSINLV